MNIDSKLFEEIAYTEKNLFELCKQYNVTYFDLHKQAAKDEDIRSKLQEAFSSRALYFFEKARSLSEEMKDFYTDKDGKKRPMRNNVQKVRLQIEVYKNICSQLAPQFFSDHSKEIKELEKRLKTLEESKRK